MADERKRKKAPPVDVDKLRREAARQQQAQRIGNLLQQLAGAVEDVDLLIEMVDEIAGYALGEPIPAELDTSWGTGAIMAALVHDLARVHRTAGDDADQVFQDLLADLRESLPQIWQAAHAPASSGFEESGEMPDET